MSEKDKLEQKLEALGEMVNGRNDFTESVMVKVRQCPKPKAAGTNRIRRLVMEKPILKWLPTATAAAILIIVLMILPSSNSGIVLADVLAKLNSVKIIKINAIQNKEDGQDIKAQFWLDVPRQIIAAQQSDDTSFCMDIRKKKVDIFTNGNKIQTVDMTDDMLKIYHFDDGDMLGLLLRVLGSEVPGLETNIDDWEKRSEIDSEIVFGQKVKSGKCLVELSMTVSKASMNLMSLQAKLIIKDSSEQILLMEFEYPQVLPEVFEAESEMDKVEHQLGDLSEDDGDNNQVSKGRGTLLAQVAAKINDTHIVKMSGDIVLEAGEPIHIGYWFDIENNIIVADASNGIQAVINLETKQQKAFANGKRMAIVDLSDEMVEAVKCDGDMLSWVLKLLGKTFPGIEHDLSLWTLESSEDGVSTYTIDVERTDQKGNVKLLVDENSQTLMAFETFFEMAMGKSQYMKASFEYPDTMPEIAHNDIEANKISKQVEQLDKTAGPVEVDEDGFSISVRVTDDNGNPVEGLYYGMEHVDYSSPRTIGSDGCFTDSLTYNPIYSDDYRSHVFVYNNDHSQATVIKVGRDDNCKHFDVVLKPTFSITGQLDFADDKIKEMADVNLYYYLNEAGGSMRAWSVTDLILNEDGSFVFAGLLQGMDYRFGVGGPGVEYIGIDVVGYASSENYDIGTSEVKYKQGFGPDVAFNRTLKGKLLDENGKPFWGLGVFAEYPGYNQQFEANSSGEFEIDGLPDNFAIKLQFTNAYGYGIQNYIAVGPHGVYCSSGWNRYVPLVGSEQFDTDVFVSDRFCSNGSIDVNIAGKDEIIVTIKPLGYEHIGKKMPQFNFKEWWVGGPVTLDCCKGKVVLMTCSLNANGNSTGLDQRLNEMTDLCEHFSGQGLEVIASITNRERYGFSEEKVKEWKEQIQARDLPYHVAYESEEGYIKQIDTREGRNCWYLIDRNGNYRGPASRVNVYKKVRGLLEDK